MKKSILNARQAFPSCQIQAANPSNDVNCKAAMTQVVGVKFCPMSNFAPYAPPVSVSTTLNSLLPENNCPSPKNTTPKTPTPTLVASQHPLTRQILLRRPEIGQSLPDAANDRPLVNGQSSIDKINESPPPQPLEKTNHVANHRTPAEKIANLLNNSDSPPSIIDKSPPNGLISKMYPINHKLPTAINGDSNGSSNDLLKKELSDDVSDEMRPPTRVGSSLDQSSSMPTLAPPATQQQLPVEDRDSLSNASSPSDNGPPALGPPLASPKTIHQRQHQNDSLMTSPNTTLNGELDPASLNTTPERTGNCRSPGLSMEKMQRNVEQSTENIQGNARISNLSNVS